MSRLKSYFLLAILAGTAGCGAPEKGRPSPASASSGEALPSQESWDITLETSNLGIRDAVVRAGHATEYRKGKKKELLFDRGITATIYDRNGGAPTVMTAGHAFVHDNQDIEAFDNVVIRSGDGMVVRTEHITRSSSDRMIRSDRYVTITKPSQTIRGYGFESDDAMKHYKIFQASGEAVTK